MREWGQRKTRRKTAPNGNFFAHSIFSTSLRLTRRPRKLFLKRPKSTPQFSLTLSALVCLNNLKVLHVLSSAPPSRVLAYMSHNLCVCPTSVFHPFHMKVSLPIRYQNTTRADLPTLPSSKMTIVGLTNPHRVTSITLGLNSMRTIKRDTRPSYITLYLGRLNQRASPLIGFLVTNSDVQGAVSIALELVLRRGFPAGVHECTGGCSQCCCAFITHALPR